MEAKTILVSDGSRRSWRLALMLVCVAVAGCAKQPSTAVFALFDISGSTSGKPIRQAYYDEFCAKVLGLPTGATAARRRIDIDRFRSGFVLRAALVTENSLANGDIGVKVDVPPQNWLRTRRLLYRSKFEADCEQARRQVFEAVLQKPASEHTDLMNALQLVEQKLLGDECRSCQRKLLVVFSDMVEQSTRYNFAREKLTDQRIEEIINAERSAGRLPDLHGVMVWVVGANAATKGGIEPDRIYAIESFWLHYFNACGADLPKSHYSHGIALPDLLAVVHGSA